LSSSGIPRHPRRIEISLAVPLPSKNGHVDDFPVKRQGKACQFVGLKAKIRPYSDRIVNLRLESMISGVFDRSGQRGKKKEDRIREDRRQENGKLEK